MSYIQGMVLNKRFWSQKSKLYPVLNKIIIQQFFYLTAMSRHRNSIRMASVPAVHTNTCTFYKQDWN